MSLSQQSSITRVQLTLLLAVSLLQMLSQLCRETFCCSSYVPMHCTGLDKYKWRQYSILPVLEENCSSTGSEVHPVAGIKSPRLMFLPVPLFAPEKSMVPTSVEH